MIRYLVLLCTLKVLCYNWGVRCRVTLSFSSIWWEHDQGKSFLTWPFRQSGRTA